MQRIDLAPSLPLPLVSHPPGQRERQGKDLGEIRSISQLAGDVADYPPQHGTQTPQRLVGSSELLGMSIALVLDEGDLAHPHIGLAQRDTMLLG